MGDFGGKRKNFSELAVFDLNTQAVFHKKMTQAQATRRYVDAIAQSMSLMREALETEDFEILLDVEIAIQEVELEKFSQSTDMVASIQKTQEDLSEGMKDYRQLLESPEAYLARGYRERDRTGPNKQFPLDTMRKALRSQAARVGNFARNPMLIPEEKAFHLLRASLLKRVEKLYEMLQERAVAAE